MLPNKPKYRDFPCAETLEGDLEFTAVERDYYKAISAYCELALQNIAAGIPGAALYATEAIIEVARSNER